jgi:hypothetical protein
MTTYCTTCNQTITSCTCDCSPCNDSIFSNCSKGSIKSECIVHSGEYGDTLLAEILTKVRRTYDNSCFGGGEAVDPFDTLEGLKDHVCSMTAPIFDLTCLGGDDEGTQQEAISLLITRVCSTGPTRSYDTGGLTVGSPSTDLATAVDQILNDVVGAKFKKLDDLDWTCLTDPASRELAVVLQAIIDEVVSSKTSYNVVDHFVLDTTDPCNTIVSLDEDKVATAVYNNFITNNTLIDVVTDNFTYKINKEDTCNKPYLMQAFSAGPNISITEKCLSLHTYSFTTSIIIAEWSFKSITLPSGVVHEMKTGSNTDTEDIRDFLLSVGVEVANVSISSGNQLTVTIQDHGDTTEYIPFITLTPSVAEGEITLSTSNATEIPGGTTCCTVHIDTIDNIDAAVSVASCNNFSGGKGISVTAKELTKVEYNLTYNTLNSLQSYTDEFGNTTSFAYTTPVYMSDQAGLKSALDSIGLDGTFEVSVNNILSKVTIKYTSYIHIPTATEPYFTIAGNNVNYSNKVVSSSDTCTTNELSVDPSELCSTNILSGSSNVTVTRQSSAEFAVLWEVVNPGYDQQDFIEAIINGVTHTPPSPIPGEDLESIKNYLNLNIPGFNFFYKQADPDPSTQGTTYLFYIDGPIDLVAHPSGTGQNNFVWDYIDAPTSPSPLPISGGFDSGCETFVISATGTPLTAGTGIGLTGNAIDGYTVTSTLGGGTGGTISVMDNTPNPSGHLIANHNDGDAAIVPIYETVTSMSSSFLGGVLTINYTDENGTVNAVLNQDLSSLNTDTNDFVSNVALVGTNLTFTGSGSAFNSTVNLSSLATDTTYTLVDGGDGTFDLVDGGAAVVSTIDICSIINTHCAVGEVNTASNVGTGQGVFKQKTASDLEFYNLIGGTNINLSLVADDIVIDAVEQRTDEQVMDIVGTLINNGTQTGISVTYNDALDKIDFEVLNPINAWQDVTYETGWSGDLQYRLRKDGTVEIKGGELVRSGLGTITSPSLVENAFSIPALAPTGILNISHSVASTLRDVDNGVTYHSYTHSGSTVYPHQAYILNQGSTSTFQASFIRMLANTSPAAGTAGVTDGFGGANGSITFYVPNFYYYNS